MRRGRVFPNEHWTRPTIGGSMGERMNIRDGGAKMALQHAQCGQIVNVRPLNGQSSDARTTAVLKAGQLEVIRLVLLSGKAMREHKGPGEVTVLCIEGRLELRSPDLRHVLGPGDLIHLLAEVPHSLLALSDTSALVTMVIKSPV